MIPLFKVLKTLFWNFSEAGHGKGAPDGVGVTLKRTCDRVVANNQDVANLTNFLSVFPKKYLGSTALVYKWKTKS